MNIFKILFVSVFVTMFFFGCSSKEVKPEVNPTDVNVKSGEGVIIVYRPDNSIWRHKRFSIYLNGAYEDILMNKSHHTFNKKPGKYLVEVREDIDLNPDTFTVEVDLNEGKVKYIKLGAKGDDGHLKLKNVIRSIANSDEWHKKRY